MDMGDNINKHFCLSWDSNPDPDAHWLIVGASLNIICLIVLFLPPSTKPPTLLKQSRVKF